MSERSNDCENKGCLARYLDAHFLYWPLQLFTSRSLYHCRSLDTHNRLHYSVNAATKIMSKAAHMSESVNFFEAAVTKRYPWRPVTGSDGNRTKKSFKICGLELGTV
jgi:hypothetical protein